MIRHSSSFLISLVFHTILFIVIIYTYKNVDFFAKKEEEKKVCVKLCCVVEKPIVKKVVSKPKVIPKKTKPKPIVKKIKPKPKPKPKPKKVEIVKKVPVVVPIIEEKIVEVIKEPLKIEEPKPMMEEIVEVQTEVEEVQIEDSKTKELRLEKEYLDENIKKIITLLRDNLYYPRSARKRGVTGEVMVKFKLSVDATARDVEIISSPSDILSRAAKRTIEELSGEFPKPTEELILHVPISYSLK